MRTWHTHNAERQLPSHDYHTTVARENNGAYQQEEDLAKNGVFEMILGLVVFELDV